MKTLIAILAHDAAQETFERHFPLWKEHEREGATLMFFSPANGKSLRVPGYQNMHVSSAEHHGKEAIRRFRTILEHMMGRTEFDQYAFMEYDSFILGPMPTLHSDFAGNIFRDTEAAKAGWMGTTFVHPPFLADNNALRKIVAEFNRMPMDVERGMWDRALGLAIERAQLTVTSWISNGYGFAENTIHPERFDELKKAIIGGVHAIHGIKTDEAFRAVMSAWSLRHQIDNLEGEGFKVSR